MSHANGVSGESAVKHAQLPEYGKYGVDSLVERWACLAPPDPKSDIAAHRLPHDVVLYAASEASAATRFRALGLTAPVRRLLRLEDECTSPEVDGILSPSAGKG
jgi:hypothetical protein